MIKNVNTIEEYKNVNKTLMISQAGCTVSSVLFWKQPHGTKVVGQIWDAINDGTIYSCPSLLASFTVICFADLKKYQFTYHFGFPALHLDSSWRVISKSTAQRSLENSFSNVIKRLQIEESIALEDSVQTWRYSVDARQYGFFLAKKTSFSIEGQDKEGEHAQDSPTTPATPVPRVNFAWIIDSLGSYEKGFFEGVNQKDCFVCFADPSTFPEYPGWMLRNLLVLVRKRWKLDAVQILCYREVHARRHESRSIIFDLELDPLTGVDSQVSSGQSTIKSLSANTPKVTGWERNLSGKVGSKIARLGEYMDPQR